jgi:hypothetical protein
MTEPLRLWLDDERPAPEGWTACRWPYHVIAHLKRGGVDEVSLDHDLGDDVYADGYDVLLWIEREVVTHGYRPPTIRIHTANPAARVRMLAAVEAIERAAESFAPAPADAPGVGE